MKLLTMLKAEKKATLAFAITVLSFCSAVALSGSSVLAQPQDPRGPGGPPKGDSDMGPGGYRDEMRRRHDGMRQEMRDEFRREHGFGPGGPEGEKGPGGPEGGGERQFGQGRIGRFLEIVQSFQTAVQDPHQAVGLAALGIKDYYRRSGKPLDAAKEIDEILKTTTDQKMRNMLLFVTRQVYEENKEGDKFLEVSRQIIKENLNAK